MVNAKKWGEVHPLAAQFDRNGKKTVLMLYSARDARETDQLKTIMQCAYLLAMKKW